MRLIEVQVDRLVGPTHHFGGLGVGNVASRRHAGMVSHPVAAALQGLDKMRLIASLGVPQIVLPPQPRADLHFLRSMGFAGRDSDVLRSARDEDPILLSAAASCSAMWTANAATVTPAVDSADTCEDGTHVTIANLNSSVHRALEPSQTMRDLANALPKACRIHEALPGGAALRDEGAANHMRIGTGEVSPAINLFVYGDGEPEPTRNWPRQTRAASQAVARLHGLAATNTFFLKQHPDAIDAGAFHNDVVAMSHDALLIHHSQSFLDDSKALDAVEARFQVLAGKELNRICVDPNELSLEDAIQTYLFNSQIVSPSGTEAPVIVCTSQVRQHDGARRLVQRWCELGVFSEAHFVDLNQSMFGGGGPACLRLRVPLTPEAVQSIPQASLWSPSLDQHLREVIETCYPTELSIDDLVSTEIYESTLHAQQQIELPFLDGSTR